MTTEKNIIYHSVAIEDLIKSLGTSGEGLGEKQAAERIGTYGKNILREGKKPSLLSRFFQQFRNVMVVTLLAAAVISILLQEVKSAYIIFVVIIVNSILGVFQENKAEKALEALKSMSAPMAKVKRRGKVQLINSEELVPGDMVLLEAGDRVPADMRLIEISNLRIDESMLTGESVPTDKTINPIENNDLPLGDQKNMAFMGCHVTYGRGTGVVTSTGMETQMGRIAGGLQDTEPKETPLQNRLTELTKLLTVAITIISVVIFAIGVIKGRELFQMLLIAVSLAVAAIPEGLPAIITIVLALGVQKMAKRHAIIRKLSTVETLGCTQVICSDKTGTLTQNQMTVQELYLGGKTVSCANLEDSGVSKTLLQIMVACNDAKLNLKNGIIVDSIGDPTEIALIECASAKHVFSEELKETMPRLNEIPFDSERKLMTTINRRDSALRVMTKGAPDILLARCNRILGHDGVQPLTELRLAEIRQVNLEMGQKALRVLGLAYKDLGELPDEVDSSGIEKDLIFTGLVGMIDPPRDEVKKAVELCVQAGIKPVMITGDHKETAIAIAKEVRILKDSREAITGAELNGMEDAELEERVAAYSVYARVSPEHKVRIVKAWKNKGKIVAMTGDGVNDAPALQAADIGIGMGITGTDVSKGVSDMVLSDDNFATIVSAVEEGRKLYNNIRKSIQFLLSTHLGEIVTLFIATLFNWMILHPIHLLWVNLITDSLPALALGVEKAESDIMREKPRDAKQSLFADGVGISILYQGILKGVITLAAFYLGMSLYSMETAVTIAFATLGLVQLTHAFTVRSNKISLYRQGILSNPYLLGAFLISGALQVLVIVIPALNDLFKVVRLDLGQWALVVTASCSIIPLVELVKTFQRKFIK